MPHQLLEEVFNKAGLPILFDKEKKEKFCIYLKELQKWNKRINLTSIKNDTEIIEKLFLDSVFLIKFFDIEPVSDCLDIGSGAGFPGIPVRIITNGLNLFLLEATKKKVSFLKHISRVLSLEKTYVISKRLEEISNDEKYFEKFGLIITRAVSLSPKLIMNSYKLLSKNGVLIYFGGEDPLKNSILEKIPFTTVDIKSYQLPISKLKRKLIFFWK
ncbi:MAG: 16S rRNA (guanine(527)-N(7))-methyltransferase RsmG [Candidatus Schekmanbacteria bacterium RBG_16_38_10]|uniref:Ribosomal RNA small subunit methyltransferase G n=1 Tax=Candidatus Schekmanbacteria bacterium RBG_16_38_10 TaxID=1817879 RepID=A0A1F7RUF0_9BACT|nr:MAG: 16S rRNA (guanine(527)-N(7))-methyltransferase RsmG [Candidatus Schekmanbacteria bacterium RBG_16_38_10]